MEGKKSTNFLLFAWATALSCIELREKFQLWRTFSQKKKRNKGKETLFVASPEQCNMTEDRQASRLPVNAWTKAHSSNNCCLISAVCCLSISEAAADAGMVAGWPQNLPAFHYSIVATSEWLGCYTEAQIRFCLQQWSVTKTKNSQWNYFVLEEYEAREAEKGSDEEVQQKSQCLQLNTSLPKFSV